MDNADSMQETITKLVSIISRITHLTQLKGPDIRDALKEIATMLDVMYAMCADTGRTLHLLYFAEGHGEALYKRIRKDEGIEALGFNQITDDTEYARKLESARKQLTKESVAKEKATKQKAVRFGGGGGSGRGRGRGRPNSHYAGWHDHQSSYGRDHQSNYGRRGGYSSYGGGQQPSGSGSWHQSGGANPHYAPHAQFSAPWSHQNRKN